MTTALNIDSRTKNGAYAEIIEVAERLGKGKYGSASNALAVMARESPLFRRTLAEIKAERGDDSTANDG